MRLKLVFDGETLNNHHLVGNIDLLCSLSGQQSLDAGKPVMWKQLGLHYQINAEILFWFATGVFVTWMSSVWNALCLPWVLRVLNLSSKYFRPLDQPLRAPKCVRRRRRISSCTRGRADHRGARFTQWYTHRRKSGARQVRKMAQSAAQQFRSLGKFKKRELLESL